MKPRLKNSPRQLLLGREHVHRLGHGLVLQEQVLVPQAWIFDRGVVCVVVVSPMQQQAKPTQWPPSITAPAGTRNGTDSRPIRQVHASPGGVPQPRAKPGLRCKHAGGGHTYTCKKRNANAP